MVEKLEELCRLIAESRIYSADKVGKLAAAFSKEHGQQRTPAHLAEWLVSKRYLTPYQAKLLLSGQSGPFFYGRYMVLGRIKAGRLAGRFRAGNCENKQKVCLQFLSAPAVQDAEAVKSVKQLAAKLSSLSDPHLARCLEFVEAGNARFLVLEDLRGASLQERMDAEGAVPAVEACRLTQQAALGLAQLHTAGQVHGDIRPENLWLEEDGTLKLLGFPIARDPLAAPPWTAGVEAWGPQAPYLAPELTRPGNAPDVRSDIYSLGCTLYHLLAGRFPEAGKPASAVPTFSPTFAARVDRLMAHDPQARPQSAYQAAEILAGGEPAELSRPAPVEEAPAASEAPLAVVEASTDAEPSVESGFPIVVGAPQASAAKQRLAVKRRSGSRLPLLISGVAVCALIAAAIGAFMLLRGDQIGNAGGSKQIVENSNSAALPIPKALPTKKAPVGPAAGSPEPTTLEGQLWASPTAGPPLDLRYLPPGAPLIVALRPARLLAHPEGEKTLQALGAWGELIERRLPEVAGIELGKIDQAVVALVDHAPDPPSATIVVRATEPLSEQSLLEKWQRPQPEKTSAGRLFRGAEWSYYLPAAGEQRVLVIVPSGEAKELLDAGDEPPLLRIEVERLVQASDSDRLLQAIFTPDFLLMPGATLASGNLQVKAALEEFLGTEVKAGLLSGHLDGPNFFAELLIAPNVERPAMAIAKTLQDRLHAAKLQLEDHVRPLSADPYSGKVLFRLPQMLAEIEKQMRVAAVDRLVAIRCYLPDRAAHNLALAGQLALETAPGSAATAVAAAPKPPAVQSIDERLKQVTSLSFPQENLENAIAALSGEIGVEIKILGSDLQLEGITRNQQFNNLNEVDKPADEILRQILIKARPDGKLVYVIGKDGDRDVVYITIRSKAGERGRLPPELAK